MVGAAALTHSNHKCGNSLPRARPRCCCAPGPRQARLPGHLRPALLPAKRRGSAESGLPFFSAAWSFFLLLATSPTLPLPTSG